MTYQQATAFGRAENKGWTPKAYLQLKKTIFYVITRPYEIEGVKGTLAVCFNPNQQQLLRESRFDEIQQAQELLKRGKRIKPGMEKYFSKTGQVDKKRLAEAEFTDGYSCIFSTKRLSKERIVRRYFDKDLVEKAFRTLKGVTNLRPVRHWLRFSHDERTLSSVQHLRMPHDHYRLINEQTLRAAEAQARKEILELVLAALREKKSVVLDDGFWKKAERDHYKELGAGAKVVLYYLPIEPAEQWRRLEL